MAGSLAVAAPATRHDAPITSITGGHRPGLWLGARILSGFYERLSARSDHHNRSIAQKIENPNGCRGGNAVETKHVPAAILKPAAKPSQSK